MTDESLLSTAEAAEILGIAPRTVTHLAQTKKLPAESDWKGTRRIWRFRRSDVEAYLAQLEGHRGA